MRRNKIILRKTRFIASGLYYLLFQRRYTYGATDGMHLGYFFVIRHVLLAEVTRCF